jgi:hypothetical protein
VNYMDTTLPANQAIPHTTSKVLPASLQEGMDVLSKMATKWPQANEQVSQTDPLWKEGLAVMDAGWAYLAAQSIGWLDQSSTALVMAGKDMSGQDPMLAYSQLGAKLEKLLNEVSQPNQRTGFMDNWHILRKPLSEPASVRLEKILEEKTALDAVAGSRMRGLRDALEMRDMSREVLAIISSAGASLRLHMQEALENEKKLVDEDKPSSPLSVQKAERAQRRFRRATSALDIIQERLVHEFSGASSDLGSLDEAVHQEELMHSRIDGLASKIASTIAGEGLKQLAADQAEHSKAIALAPVEELTPLQVLEQQLPVAPRKTGFLDRLFSRNPLGPKVSKESSKILRNMTKFTGDAAFASTLSEVRAFRKGPQQDEFWHDIVTLMSDETVSPSHKIGSKTLLGLMFEMANTDAAIDLREQYEFGSKLSLITMLATRHPDGPKELRAVPQQSFAPLCARAIIGTEEEQSSTPPSRPSSNAVAQGFLLWETLGFEESKEFFNAPKIISKFLLATPSNYMDASVRDKAVKVVEDMLLNSRPDRLDSTKLSAAKTVLPYLSNEAVSKFGVVSLSAKIQEGQTPHSEDVELLYKMGLPACDKLAAVWMMYRHRANPTWVRHLLAANEKRMHAAASIDRVEDSWGDEYSPYVTLEDKNDKQVAPAKLFTRKDFANLTLISQCGDMLFSVRPQKQWPKELCAYAFENGNIQLLNDLIQNQPQAQIIPAGALNGVAMLTAVIQADIRRRNEGSADPNASSTDPAYWCKVFSPFVDGKQPLAELFKANGYFDDDDMWETDADVFEESDLDEFDDPSPIIPKQTPLMIACAGNALPWIKALLQAGASPTPQDSKGQVAMTHWCQAISQAARKSCVEHSKVARRGYSHSEVNEPKAKALFIKNMVAAMNETGFWDLTVANQFAKSTNALLAEVLYLDLENPQNQETPNENPVRELQERVIARKLAIEHFTVSLSSDQFIAAVSNMVSPPGKLSPNDPGIEKAVAYGRKAGLFSPYECAEILDRVVEESKNRAMKLVEERNMKMMISEKEALHHKMMMEMSRKRKSMFRG